MISDKFKKIGEYGAAGMYEDTKRSLFYRKALGIRRFYENCKLPDYNKEFLYPSGKLLSDMDIRLHFLLGMNIDYNSVCKKNKELADLYVSEFNIPYSSIPIEHTVAGDMYTHSMPNYERILKEGLFSYIKRIEKINDEDIRDGLLHIIEGIKNYIERCTAYLEAKKADKKLISSETFEEFYRYYINEVKSVADTVTDEITKAQKKRAECNPLPMRTLLVDDCIDKGKDFNNDGARYKWSVINFAGMINVIDSMLVIRDFVFIEKNIPRQNL